MMNSMKNLTIAIMVISGLAFGQEAVASPETSTVKISGEFSTDITFGDAITFESPYTGLIMNGDGWIISTNLSDGMINVEEANYSWSMTDDVKLTFGSQAEPYGLAWGLHRPASNSFVSAPRDHSVTNGVGIDVDKWGANANVFYGGSTEDVVDDSTGAVIEEGSHYWAVRASYELSLFGINSELGLSLNSSEAQLVDVSSKGSALGFPYEVSFEYDLAAKDDAGESSPSYWLRSTVSPEFAKGAYLLFGYNSDEEVLYGVGYKCSDNMKIITEMSSDDEEGSGISIRASYSF